MWLAFVTAYFALRAEIHRRKVAMDPANIIIWMVIAGILGAKLWHIMDTPADRPTLDTLFSRAILPCQAGAPHHSRVARPLRGKRLTTRGPAFTAI